MNTDVVTQSILPALAKRSHLMMPIAAVCIIAVMIIPLPPLMLDLLVTLDITLSVVILMSSMYIEQPVSSPCFLLFCS